MQARYLERINGKPIIDFDDVKHLIDEKYQNLDMRKVNEYSIACFGKPIGEMNESFIGKLQPWQSNLKCLRSISNFGVRKKPFRKRVEEYLSTSPTKRKSTIEDMYNW